MSVPSRRSVAAAQAAADSTHPTIDPARVREFLDSKTYFRPGSLGEYAEVYKRFLAWLPLNERLVWTKRQFSRHLPPEHPSGSRSSNVCYVGNVSLTPIESTGKIAVRIPGRRLRVISQ